MVLSNVISDFLKDLEHNNASKLTIRNYRHYLNRFLEFIGDVDPKYINLEQAEKYKSHLSKWIDPISQKALKPVTQNYFLIALRQLMLYLRGKNIIEIDIDKIALQESRLPKLEVLEDSQYQLLLDGVCKTSPEGFRDMAILETLFSTGVKVSELCRLNRDDLNLMSGNYCFAGEGSKRRRVSLPDGVCMSLQKYLRCRKDAYKPLFIRFQGKQKPENSGESMRLSARSIQRIVEKYVKKQCLPIKATPQTLRYGFAASKLALGHDNRTVARMLGNNFFVKLK